MGERAPLDAVLFDAGGTLGRLDFEWMAEAVRELGHPLDVVTLRAAEVEGRRRYDRSVGVPEPGDAAGPAPQPDAVNDPHPYFFGMLAASGVPEVLIPAAIERWRSRQAGEGLWSRVNEGSPEALAGVRRLGLRRAVVSNSDGRAEQHIRDWGVLGELEFVIDSQLVGVAKPDPRIFQLALDRMGLAAERVLYVGDVRCCDEVGSRAAGLHFVLIDASGRYAAPGAPRIGCIAELPCWIEQRFIVPGVDERPAVGPAPRAATFQNGDS